MKKFLFSSLVSALVLGAATAAAATVEVDFAQKDVLTKGFPLQLRYKGTLTEKGLVTTGALGSGQSAATKKIHKEFSPAGAFTFTADFTLDKAPAKVIQRYIFDNKYVTYPNAKQQKYHKGFAVNLRQVKGGFRVYTAFGYGEKSVEVCSNIMPLKIGKKYSIEIDFDAAGTVTYYLDGKLNSRMSVPAGSIAVPSNLTAFGNRVGSSFYPLNGTLHKVTIGDIKDRTIAPGTVLGNWDFSKPETYKDMTIRGKETKIVDGALSVMTAGYISPGGITTKEIDPNNTPSRAFELDAEFSLSSEFKRYRNNPSMILDSKYVARPAAGPKNIARHSGFMLNLQPRGNNKYRIGAAFGFGTTSTEIFSKDVTIEFNKTYTLNMLFTATGKVVFKLNGNLVSEHAVPAGSLASAKLTTTIGDRHGSNYYPFGGSIKKVVIKEAEFKPVSVSPSAMHRKVFQRGEMPEVAVDILNASLLPLKNVEVEMSITGLNPEKKKLM